jgi:hypothetical protein
MRIGVSETENASSFGREPEAHVPGKGVVYEMGNNAHSSAAELHAQQRVSELEAGYNRLR